MRISIFLVFLMMLSGCSVLKTAVALTQSTDDFKSLERDSRIQYEDGAAELAKAVASHLRQAIDGVENRQGSFKQPVVIYVTKSIESFSSYCASSRPSACVIGDRLFISPKLLTQQERTLGILMHELSHLQHTQDIGVWAYQTKLPVWFKEGLAVYVSNGSGAEGVTKKEAIAAIRQGKSIQPNGSGGLLFRKTASSFGLKPHMFYRQSEIFVTWLHEVSPNKFLQLFVSLEKGNTLDEALLSVYGFNASEGWEKYKKSLS